MDHLVPLESLVFHLDPSSRTQTYGENGCRRIDQVLEHKLQILIRDGSTSAPQKVSQLK